MALRPGFIRRAGRVRGLRWLGPSRCDGGRGLGGGDVEGRAVWGGGRETGGGSIVVGFAAEVTAGDITVFGDRGGGPHLCHLPFHCTSLPYTLAGVADEPSRASTLRRHGCSAIVLRRQSASRPSTASRLDPSSSGLSNHTGPSAPCWRRRTSSAPRSLPRFAPLFATAGGS